jgi:hypothetical protein
MFWMPSIHGVSGIVLYLASCCATYATHFGMAGFDQHCIQQMAI